MTQRRGRIGSPRDLLADGTQWPDGALLPDLDESSAAAAQFASSVSARLAAALDGRSVAEVSRQADVARSTVYDLVAGATWPDVVSIFKLEHALATPLWVRPDR